MLDFDRLRAVNVQRCGESFHPIGEWSPTDWACAMGGECGEALNIVKKLRRLQTEGDSPANVGLDRATLLGQLCNELADVIIYADLLAARLDLNLGVAVVYKFNLTSQKVGSPLRL